GNLSDQYKQTDAPLRMLAAASWYRDTKTWERGFGYDPNDATWNRKPVSQWTRYNKRATCNQTESPQPNDWINFENFETRYSGPGDHYSFTSCFYGYLMSGMPSEFEAAEGMVFYFDACAVHTASDRFEQLTRMVNFNGVSYNTWTALWPEVSTPPVTAFPGFKWNRRDPPENGHLPNKQLLEYYLLTGDPATLDAVKSFGMFAIGLTTHDVLRYKQQPIADSIIMNGNRYTTRPGIVAGEAYEATGDERYLNRMKLTVYGMRNYVRQNPIGYDGLIDNGYNKAVSIWNYWNSIHPDIPAPKTFANADMQTGISLQDLYYYWQLTHDEEIRDATINVAKSFDWRTGRKADGKPSGAVYAPWADYLSEGKSYADIPSAATSAYWNSAAIEGWTGCNFGYLISGMSSLWEISSEGYKQMQQEGVLGNYKTTGSALQFVTFNNYGTFFLKNLNTFEAKRKHDSLDCTPPPAVQDLKAVQQGSTIQLSWTSPGGNASSYRIKVAEAPIVSEVAHWSYETHRGWPDLRNLPYTDSALINRGINYQKEQEANFWSANGISNQIIPQGEGKGESFLVTGLDPQKTWYFALVSWDTANNVSNISNVVTNKPFLTSLEIRCNKDTIAVAMKASLTASVTYSGGLIEAGNLHVRYSTPDTNIAQVTFDGFVIGRAPGKVRVIASKGVDPLTDTLTLVVILNNTKPDSLRVNMFSDAKDQWPYRVFCKGDTFPLHVATAYYHDGTNVITLPLTDSMVKWFSIDSTKAVVEYGRIILKDTGIVEVGCEYNGCRSTKTITIIAKPPVLKRINFGGVETTYCRDLIVRHGWTNDVALKYTSARGYGWPADRGGAVRCNRAGNWLVRSLVTSSGEKWRVDVPKGQYTVLMSIGDNVYIGSGYCLAGLDTIAKKNSTTLNQLCAAKVTVSSDSGMQITAYAPVNYIVILSSGYDINKYADIGIDTIPNPNMIETNSQQEIKRATLKEYPNPFNPIVTICYALPANIGATYTIYNIQGEIVFQKSLIKSSRGYRGLFVWNGVNRLTGKKAASGSYIGTLNLSDHKRISNKLLLLK
ncbi:MAG: hypothetical protein JNL74_23575, partial [Fibrobacteres bacterium]|nr:hypothetical protein [Fibrobacterota bacterium]